MHHFNTLNQDYGEFLALKGVFNIPIVRYPPFPFQLSIHFIFSCFALTNAIVFPCHSQEWFTFSLLTVLLMN